MSIRLRKRDRALRDHRWDEELEFLMHAMKTTPDQKFAFSFSVHVVDVKSIRTGTRSNRDMPVSASRNTSSLVSRHCLDGTWPAYYDKRIVRRSVAFDAVAFSLSWCLKIREAGIDNALL